MTHISLLRYSNIKPEQCVLRGRDLQWQDLIDSYHEKLSVGHWISVYGFTYIGLRMADLQSRIERITKLLYNKRKTVGNMSIIFSANLTTEGVLPFDERLYSRWMMLFQAMAGSKCWASFTVTNIEWPSALSDMMATALSERKERCRYNFHRFGSGQGYFSGEYEIRLCNNNLNRGDMSGVSSIIQQDKGLLIKLVLEKNVIDTVGTANQFSTAMKNNESLNLDEIQIKDCSLGSNTRVLSMVISACSNLHTLCLGSNSIRSRGVAEITNFIASNPTLQELDLSNNELTDNDASLIADSLQSNTNLDELILGSGNNFSHMGIDTLANAVYDTTDLNALFDCNNTCKIFLGSQHDHRFNFVDFEHKLYKVLVGHNGDGCLMNIHYLNDVPLELMPNVLFLILKTNQSNLFGKHRSESLVFEIMRKWHLPLLYYYRGSQNCHPQDVVLCIDELVSKVSGDGINGIDFHNALLPFPMKKSEYNVIVPTTSEGLLLLIGGLSGGSIIFMGYRPRKDGSKGTAEFFNLMRPGDVITGINGMTTVGKPFEEVTAMLKDSLLFIYLRLEERSSFKFNTYPQSLEIIASV